MFNETKYLYVNPEYKWLRHLAAYFCGEYWRFNKGSQAKIRYIKKGKKASLKKMVIVHKNILLSRHGLGTVARLTNLIVIPKVKMCPNQYFEADKYKFMYIGRLMQYD